MRRRCFGLGTTALLMVFCILWGQAAAEPAATTSSGRKDLADYSLEELLNVGVAVASSTVKGRREVPGVVSVITRQEIENSGARDLIDVLRLVPGFEFGIDDWGVVSIGFRGLWGQEGKILLRVDGHEMNDLMYTGMQLGNHFSVDQIERVEVIRGPGSAIYGGYAELAVINVITKIGDETPGFNASFTSGFFKDTYARQNLQASYGHALGAEGYVGVSMFQGFAQRSNLDYVDIFGDRYNMKGNSHLDPTNINFHLRQGPFKVKFMYDNYRNTQRDGYGAVLPRAIDDDFRSYFAEAAYEIEFSDSLTLTPQFSFKGQEPWYSVDVPPEDADYFYNPRAFRYRPLLKLDYVPVADLTLSGGIQTDLDEAEYGDLGPLVFKDGNKSVSYWDFAAFGEGNYLNPLVDITAGLRFEDHQLFGSSFAPRLGLVKVYRDFNAKFVYNHAFRYPSIAQIDSGVDNIRPERTDVFEVEGGYKINEAMYLSANFYDVRIKRPIVYFIDPATGIEWYSNFDKLGTRGAEVEYRIKGRWGYVTFNYSYYLAAHRGVEQYQVPGEDGLFLAFPAHKATAVANWQVNKNFSINPSLVFLSKRFGYDRSDPATGEAQISELDPRYLVNLYFLYRNALVKGLDAGFGIFDLFGQNYRFIQPYNSGHAPLPGPSREFLLKLSYNWL